MTENVTNERIRIEKELIKKINNLPKLGYKSRTPLFDINGIDITSNNIITGALMIKDNVLIIGSQGKVKTERAYDIRDGFFNGNATFIRGRKDITASSIMLDMELDKLKNAKSEKDIYKRNNNTDKKLVIIDEANRTHGAIQQELFGISDGHFEKDGIVHYIGAKLNGCEEDRYVSVIGTANIGEEFDNVFRIDKALLDRYTIIDTDLYPTDPTSYMEYLLYGNDRINNEANIQELYILFRDYYRYSMMEGNYGLTCVAITEYLRSGLTYCTKDKIGKENIKVKLKTNFCDGCHDKTRGCPMIPFAFERGAEKSNKMALALDLITRAKTSKERSIDMLPTNLAKTHAFRLGPILKISGEMDRMMITDTTLNPLTILTQISKFIVDDIESAKEKINKLIIERGEILKGKRKNITPALVNWFEEGRWIGVYNGFMGMNNDDE
jgi:hypothetical protein